MPADTAHPPTPTGRVSRLTVDLVRRLEVAGCTLTDEGIAVLVSVTSSYVAAALGGDLRGPDVDWVRESAGL